MKASHTCVHFKSESSLGKPGFRRTALASCIVLITTTICASTSVQAQSLQAVYESAQTTDASYLAARAQFQASLAKAEQAKAGVLPNVGLSAEGFLNNSDSSDASLDSRFNNEAIRLVVSHPLYRPVNRLSLEQAEKSLQVAQSQLDAAEQELIVRTGQAYFDVLAADDSLSFVRAQKAAVSEQLAAARQNFEVGTSTVTDTKDAQARFDLVRAQEIAAESELRIKKLALDQLVVKPVVAPWRLRLGVELPGMEMTGVESWVARAEKAHPLVRQAMAGLEISQLETSKAKAGHKPTVDAIAQTQWARAPSTVSSIPGNVRNTTTSIGVQFNLPLFAGYSIQNRVKETLALEDKAGSDLDAAKRNTAQATRTAYLGVVSGLGQVKALEAAEASSQSALEANQLGYQVGVRINIDVLNAQSQLFQTKASLAKARYDVLLGSLKLRQASGVLMAQDLQPINALLTE